MSNTPRTDAYENSILDAEVTKHPHREFKGAIRFAQQLERELAMANNRAQSLASQLEEEREAHRAAVKKLAQRPEARTPPMFALSTTQEERDEWRKKRFVGMTSAVGEYTPSEFWDLLNDVDRLVREFMNNGG